MRVRADAPTSASRPPFVSCRGRSGFASRADGQEPTREGVAAAPGDARQPTHPATPAVSDGGFGMTEADVNPALFTQEEIEQVVRRAVVRGAAARGRACKARDSVALNGRHPPLLRSRRSDRSKRLLIPLTFKKGIDCSAARLYQPTCTTVPSPS